MGVETLRGSIFAAKLSEDLARVETFQERDSAMGWMGSPQNRELYNLSGFS